MSPCKHSALYPFLFKTSIKSSTFFFVLQKITALVGLSKSINLIVISSFIACLTVNEICSILSTVNSFDFILILIGSVRYFLAILRILAFIVAENSTVCLDSGIFDNISLISSSNPIFNISSASSKITILILSNFNVFLLI
ncbi:hypothetical protein D3C72_886990 [compost metagenome]